MSAAPDAALLVSDAGNYRRRLRSARALTLVEVMFACGILSMVVLGVLQGILQSLGRFGLGLGRRARAAA